MKGCWPRARRSFGQAREGNETADVEGTPFWIECAKGTSQQIHAKLAQAIEASTSKEDSRIPVVVSHAGGRKPPMVTMRLQDFLDLFKDGIVKGD